MNRSEMLARLKKGEDPLELSIEKYQDIVDGKAENEGSENCALCEVYSGEDKDCRLCPVRKRTRQPHCYGTPYYDRDSQKELEFLKGLRKAKKA